MHEWTSEHVREWIAQAEGGRFANLALPAAADGKALLSIPARGFAALFSGSGRQARGTGEGASWTVGLTVEDGNNVAAEVGDAAQEDEVEWVDLWSNDGAEATPAARAEAIGRALYNSLRKEHVRQLLSASQSTRAVRGSHVPEGA